MRDNLIQNPQEILNFLAERNIINLVDTQMQIENMKRKEYLEMHNHKIWKGKDGVWRTYVDDENTSRKIKLKTATTEEKIYEVIINYYQDKECDPYINQVFDEWNNRKLEYGEISVQTYNRYLTDYKRFFKKDCILCKMKFRQITEENLEDFIKSTIRDYSLTAKSYAGLRTIIQGIFKYGKKKKYTNISITTFFGDLDLSKKCFSRKVRDKEKEVFNEDEIERVKRYLRDSGKIRDLGVLLAFETGLRVGELSALKWCDVNEDESLIHVRRTEITYKDPQTGDRICEVRNSTKSEAGDRDLVITDNAIVLLQEIRKISHGTEYVFFENGKRIRENAFNRRLTRVCDSLHIEHRSMHKIRKTYGTTLLDSGVPESIVAEQLGHKDVATTKRFYYIPNKNNKTKQEYISKALANLC